MAIAACTKTQASAPPAGDIVATLPTKTIDDRPFDPGSLKGKPSIVMFASPTCGYCIQEMPAAQAAAQSQGANAIVVFVSGSKQDGAQIAAKQGFTGVVLHDDGTLKTKYGIRGVPYTLVAKADGTATKAFKGMTDEATLASAVASAK